MAGPGESRHGPEITLLSPKGVPIGTPFSLSKNCCLAKKSTVSQGELEGAKPASNEIECLQKACVSRRLRRAAAVFQIAWQFEIRGIVKAVEKVQRTFSTACGETYGFP